MLKFLFVVVTSANQDNCVQEYDSWLASFGKTRPENYAEKLQVFCDTIHPMNLRSSTDSFDARKSPFADMTSQQFAEYYHLKENAAYLKSEMQSTVYIGLRGVGANLGTPDEYSHENRSPPRVTSVQDQGSCGSCWAFGIAGACEGAVAMHHDFQTNLSEAWQLDCARWNINGQATHAGCNGGNMPLVMKHIIMKDAVIPDESVAHAYQPYDKGDTPYSQCKSSYSKGVKLVQYGSNYVHSASNENAMKALMVQRGPLVVAIDGEKIQNYDGRIINGNMCNNYQLNHAVVLTAYDVEKYTLKNSWGTSWGDNGYFYIAPGQECIGIGTWADACIAEPASGSDPSPTPTPTPSPTTPGPNPEPEDCQSYLNNWDWCAWAKCKFPSTPMIIDWYC
jgi:C1A family cysteine protease